MSTRHVGSLSSDGGRWRVVCSCGWRRAGIRDQAGALGHLRQHQRDIEMLAAGDGRRREREAVMGTFDCHGYKVRTATEFAPEFVADCWRRGLPKTKFIHGGNASGRDAIGRRLHAMLTAARVDPYAHEPMYDGHDVGSDVLVVALRPHPRPESYATPVDVPEPEYDRKPPD